MFVFSTKNLCLLKSATFRMIFVCTSTYDITNKGGCLNEMAVNRSLTVPPEFSNCFSSASSSITIFFIAYCRI